METEQSFTKFSYEKDATKEELELYTEFVDNGTKFEVYMPISPEQELQWTIKLYNVGEDEPFRIDYLVIYNDPFLGVDIEDSTNIQRYVEGLIEELNT